MAATANGHRTSLNMYQIIPSAHEERSSTREKMKRRLMWPLPRRYVVCSFTFLNMIVLYSMRLNLSVAVVTMTNYRTETLDNGTTYQVRDFDWSPRDQGYILSSFYYGYLVSELPCACLSDRFGAATVLGFEVAATALFTALIPSVAAYGPVAIFLFRALAGIFEGGTLPVTDSLWSRWAPSEERTILTTITSTGYYVSNIICFPLYGYLASYYGWKSLFYVPAMVGLICCVPWFANVRSDPSDDPKITDSELNYIRGSNGCKYPKQTTYPWKAIFTSTAVWANIVGYFSSNWSYTIILTTVPTYLKDVWNVDVKDSGVWLMIPFIMAALITPVLGILADYLRNYKGCSTVKVRIFFHAVGGFGGAICICLFGTSSNHVLAIIFLTLLQMTNSFFFGSFFVNTLDIAPRYANVIIALCCSIGSTASLIAPTLAGYIVTYQNNKFGWTMVYFLCGIVHIVGTIFYIIFCSGEIQPWAEMNPQCEQDLSHTEQIARSECKI